MRVEASCIYFARAVIAPVSMNLHTWPHAFSRGLAKGGRGITKKGRKKGEFGIPSRARGRAIGAMERPSEKSRKVEAAWLAFKDARGHHRKEEYDLKSGEVRE